MTEPSRVFNSQAHSPTAANNSSNYYFSVPTSYLLCQRLLQLPDSPYSSVYPDLMWLFALWTQFSVGFKKSHWFSVQLLLCCEDGSYHFSTLHCSDWNQMSVPWLFILKSSFFWRPEPLPLFISLILIVIICNYFYKISIHFLEGGPCTVVVFLSLLSYLWI